MLDATTFGGRVRRERLRRGDTQTALAERAGISNSYLSDIEREAHSVPTDTALRIAVALNVPVAALLGVAAANQVWPPPGPLNDLLTIAAAMPPKQLRALLVIAETIRTENWSS